MTADTVSVAEASRRYTGTSRALHWLTALFVFGMLAAGLTMTSLGPGPLQDTLYSAHKVSGITLMLIIAVRIVWRMTHRPPALEPVAGHRVALAARTNHVLLYVLLVIQVISGYVLTKAGGYPIPFLDDVLPSLVPKSKPLGDTATLVHQIGKIAILALVALHVAGALYHLLVRKDGVFRRMWPIGEAHG